MTPICAQVYDRGENEFVAVYWENDTFYDTDQSYTNGVRLTRIRSLSPDDDHWWLPDDLLKHFLTPSCADDPELCWERAGGWTLGQSIYTPQNIRIAQITPDDRPYGGFLYVGAVFHGARTDQGDMKGSQHTLELLLGVTGQPSLADRTQDIVHKYVRPSAPDPKGWDHQVPFEPGIVLRYAGRTRALEGTCNGKRVFDLSPNWEIAAGNVFTHASAGAFGRIGLSLGDDFGTGRIQPVAPLMGRRSDWEAYVFAALETKAVARNLFLDGGLRAAPQTVTKERVVADIESGVFGRYKRVGASFRWVRRTPEFTERRIYQEYGAWNVTFLL